MMDFAFRAIASENCEYITLGLSPLSKRAKIEPFDNPLWLRVLLAWMRKHAFLESLSRLTQRLRQLRQTRRTEK